MDDYLTIRVGTMVKIMILSGAVSVGMVYSIQKEIRDKQSLRMKYEKAKSSLEKLANEV